MPLPQEMSLPELMKAVVLPSYRARTEYESMVKELADLREAAKVLAERIYKNHAEELAALEALLKEPDDE